MQALQRACMLSGGDPVELSDSDNDSGDESSEADVDLLRRLQERFALPAPSTAAETAIKPVSGCLTSGSDEDEDFETLRSIRRRFAQYESDALNMKSGNHLEESRMVVSAETPGREATSEEIPDSVTTELNHTEAGMYNISAKAFTYSQFPKSAQCFVDALRKNRSCQKFIRRKLIEIEAKVEENKELRERIKCLMDFQATCKRKVGRMLGQEKDPRARLISVRKSSTPKSSWRKFPALYFGPAENSHVSKYKMVMRRFPVSLCKLPWSNIENENLVKGIKKQYQEMLILNSMNIESDLETSGDTILVPALSSSDLEVTPEKIRSFIPLVNWDRLASMYLTGRSGEECESRWLNCEDPMVNRNPWTLEEDKKLLYIVQERGVYNWIDIAITLGTHRTPFLCLLRYQRSLNPHILNRDWTNEEDVKLRVAVNAFGFDWQVVASSVEGRSGPQCSNRWRKTLNPDRKKVGRWSVDEDKRLKVAVLLLGAKNWSKIATFAPGRTQVQCRERWLNCLDPSLNLEPWTKEADSKLLEAIEKLGYSWSKVATCVPPRTDCQCRRRWRVLLPHEVPLLQAAKKMKRTVLISNFVDRESERPLIGPNDFLSLVVSPADEVGNNKTVRKKASSDRPNKSKVKSKTSLKKSLKADGMVNSSFEVAPTGPSPLPGSIAESGSSKRRKETSSSNQNKKPRVKSRRCTEENSTAVGVNSSDEIDPCDASLVPDVSTTAERGRSMKRINKRTPSDHMPNSSRAKPGSSLEECLTADAMINSSSVINPADLSLVPCVNPTTAENGSMKRTRKRTSSNNLPKMSRVKSGSSLEETVAANAMIRSSSEIAPDDLSHIPCVNSAAIESGSMKRTRNKTSRYRAKSGSSVEEHLASDAMMDHSSEIAPADISLVPGVNPTTAENESKKRKMKTTSSNIPSKMAKPKPGSSLKENLTAQVMTKSSTEISPGDLSCVPCVKAAATEIGSMKSTRKKISSGNLPNGSGAKPGSAHEENLTTNAMINCSSETDPADLSLVPGVNPATTESGTTKRIRKRTTRYQDYETWFCSQR